jgi:methylase of polypeptide subunit release factors
MTGPSRGMQLLAKWERENTAPATFELGGREWDLLPGVFSPADAPATGLFTQWLHYPAGGSFCDMGCGAGVTAVTAALAGCRQVVASDVSEEAVANAAANAARHGVNEVVDLRRGDLFESFSEGERFDVVYWNSNFSEAPVPDEGASSLHRALFDPGYRTHERFCEQAPSYVAPGGRLLLGFADIGNSELLRELAGKSGLAIRAVRAQRLAQPPVEFQLLELFPAGGGPWN